MMRFLIRPNRWFTAVSLAMYALGNVLAVFSHNHGGMGACCHGDVCEHAAPAVQHEAEHGHTHSHAHGHKHATCSHQHHRKPEQNKTVAPGETWWSESDSDSIAKICLACQFLAQKAVWVAVNHCEDCNDLWVGQEAVSERLNLHRLPLAFTARGPPSLV
jgi:hypothetical protein